MLLNRKRSRNRASCDFEYRQHRIARHVYHATLIRFDLRSEHGTRGVQRVHRRALVG